MNHPWAIQLSREDASSLAALRLITGIEVAEAGAAIWLRGRKGDDQLGARLAAIPAHGRYEWTAPDQLRQLDRRIPSARLPNLPWQPLNTWLQVEMPVAAFPAIAPERIRVQLVPSTDEREPELLLTRIEELKRFATDAAQVRLDRLQFAANADGSALVRGRPLPPLPGRRFVLYGQVAVPAGFSWQPAVGADVLGRCFQVSGDDLILWDSTGTITRLHGEQFVPAARSAILATERSLAELTS